MEFFKKSKPRNKFEDTNIAVDRKIEDQRDIEIKGDTSIEDYSEKLNSRIVQGTENIDPFTPFEEIKLNEQLANRFEHLLITYNEIKHRLTEKQDSNQDTDIRDIDNLNKQLKKVQEDMDRVFGLRPVHDDEEKPFDPNSN